ncbi:MAG: hypothetical protein MUC42_15195, partial [Bryobacter sp.]|nr:hypothetical protein [Bryobacter sp.]
PQAGPRLAWRIATEESPEMRRIRERVIVIYVPVINPDGLDRVAAWYRGNVGTPYETAPMPERYQKYAGHDNNRDYFMLNLAETRHVSRMLFREWFPQIVYDQHQAPAFPARIFVPPYAEPMNPHIPGPVIEGINLIGAAMKERLGREGKTGVLSYLGFDAWWNGGLRTAPAFHNMHGVLTETALNSYATPREYSLSDLPDVFPNGMPAKEPSIFYTRPWKGGRWGVGEAIEYMESATLALLEVAAARSEQFLLKSWELARANIDAGRKGKPFAYVIDAEQWDRTAAATMVERLGWAGVVVERARAPFRAGGREFPEGTWILPAAQPFRAYLMDLMEPQRHPDTGRRPYDMAGWTMRMQMGVEVARVEEPFKANTARAELVIPKPRFDARDTGSFLSLAKKLGRGEAVSWTADGKLVEGSAPAGGWELRSPRVGLYEPFTANLDTGWTAWLMDTFEVPFRVLRNDDVRRNGLRSRFDTIVLARQTAASILNGIREGEPQRPEYAGGIGIAGLAQLEAFVRDGGTLIALDDATELPLSYWPVAAQGLLRPRGDSDLEPPPPFDSPGSILRIQLEAGHPVCFGMPGEAFAVSTGGQAFEVTSGAKVLARYAARNLLASGWLQGEHVVRGRPVVVEAPLGEGRVILFGFRPQFRGQSWGTFRMLLNAIYYGSAQKR